MKHGVSVSEPRENGRLSLKPQRGDTAAPKSPHWGSHIGFGEFPGFADPFGIGTHPGLTWCLPFEHMRLG
jgi:hypothetical protein